MARYKDDVVKAALQPHLHPGEELEHWAYGVKQPPLALIIGLTVLALLPGLIATAILTKEYIVGTTRDRLIVCRVSGGKATVKEVREFALGAMPPVKTSTGALFTHIRIEDPKNPFVAKFHRAGMKDNKAHAAAIAAAISKPALAGPAA